MDMKRSGGFLVSRLKAMQARVFEKMLREEGLDAFSGAQGRILFVLWDASPQPISALCGATSLAKTTLTGLLDRMEARGLIIRTRDGGNRRQVLISLTDEARAFREGYDRISARMNGLFYQGFAEREAQTLDALLARALRNVSQYEEEHP